MGNSRISIGGGKLALTISLTNNGLCRHGNRTRLSNNLLLVGLINVASQSGDQQGSQDSQDDQNHDQLDQGKTFAVLEFTNFFEHNLDSS